MVINSLQLIDWLIDWLSKSRSILMAFFDNYVILQLLFRLRQNEIVPQMTPSLLPCRFDLEDRGRCGRNVSTFRRLIYRISSIRRNINMKFDKRTVGLPFEDKLTCSGKISIKCHFEQKVIENFDQSQRNSTYDEKLLLCKRKSTSNWMTRVE